MGFVEQDLNNSKFRCKCNTCHIKASLSFQQKHKIKRNGILSLLQSTALKDSKVIKSNHRSKAGGKEMGLRTYDVLKNFSVASGLSVESRMNAS